MKAIFLLFDSLNLKALSCYGGPVQTPNFDRLSRHSVRFQNHYTGSLPCIPARRDMHTGRYSFFHSGWGPMEPYDDSLPRLLKSAKGTYSHLITDHFHYFEDGGCGFHTKFDSYDFIRGQEYDPCHALVEPPIAEFQKQYHPGHYNLAGDPRSNHKLQHLVNRKYIQQQEDFPIHKCFQRAFDFLNTNRKSDNWFLQLECFDPHEPFHAPDKYIQKYSDKLDGLVMDWPNYDYVSESEDEIREIRARYAALVAMCDDYLGQLLDYMDEHDMWKDTMLVMTTDHGYLLSEHNWWAKARMPYYQEISHIPLMIHHPDFKAFDGQQRSDVSNTIDVMSTILDAFNVEIPKDVQGESLLGRLERDSGNYRVVASGIFGGSMLLTDGDYAYHFYPDTLDSTDLYEYRLMPAHMRGSFSLAELRDMTLSQPFDFTKGVELLKIKARDDSKRIPNHDGIGFADTGTRLFDLRTDPQEQNPVTRPDIEEKFKDFAFNIMKAHDAPEEMYRRFHFKTSD